MAEVVGLAASIVQIAGIGVKLSAALYSYASSAARADEDIKDFASDVEITANALSSVGEVFGSEDAQSVISNKAILDAKSLIKRCEVDFDEINKVIEKRLKPCKDGKRALTTLGRFSWPLKEQGLELFRRRLESRKSSLTLLLHVLQLASVRAKGQLGKSALEKEYERIRQLHQQQQESLKRLQAVESSLSKISLDDDPTLAGSMSPTHVNTTDSVIYQRQGSTQPRTKLYGNSFISTSTIDSSLKADSDVSEDEGTITNEEGEHLKIEDLSRCTQHVQELLRKISTLQQTFEHSQAISRYPRNRVHKLYRRFCRNFESDLFRQSNTTSSTTLPLPVFQPPSQISRAENTFANASNDTPEPYSEPQVAGAFSGPAQDLTQLSAKQVSAKPIPTEQRRYSSFLSSLEKQEEDEAISPSSSPVSTSPSKVHTYNEETVPEVARARFTTTGRLSKARKGLKVHNCWCGRTYSRAEHLRRHQANHSAKSFPCNKCGKTFGRVDLLRRHQERHSTEDLEMQTTVATPSFLPSVTATTSPLGPHLAPNASNWFGALMASEPSGRRLYTQMAEDNWPTSPRRHEPPHLSPVIPPRHVSEPSNVRLPGSPVSFSSPMSSLPPAARQYSPVHYIQSSANVRYPSLHTHHHHHSLRRPQVEAFADRSFQEPPSVVDQEDISSPVPRSRDSKLKFTPEDEFSTVVPHSKSLPRVSKRWGSNDDSSIAAPSQAQQTTDTGQKDKSSTVPTEKVDSWVNEKSSYTRAESSEEVSVSPGFNTGGPTAAALGSMEPPSPVPLQQDSSRDMGFSQSLQTPGAVARTGSSITPRDNPPGNITGAYPPTRLEEIERVKSATEDSENSTGDLANKWLPTSDTRTILDQFKAKAVRPVVRHKSLNLGLSVKVTSDAAKEQHKSSIKYGHKPRDEHMGAKATTKEAEMTAKHTRVPNLSPARADADTAFVKATKKPESVGTKNFETVSLNTSANETKAPAEVEHFLTEWKANSMYDFSLEGDPDLVPGSWKIAKDCKRRKRAASQEVLRDEGYGKRQKISPTIVGLDAAEEGAPLVEGRVDEDEGEKDIVDLLLDEWTVPVYV